MEFTLRQTGGGNPFWKKHLARIGLVLMVVAAACAACPAATLMVSGDNPQCSAAPYKTITAAINAAAPGDVIAICPALYAEQLVITKPLTLRGLTLNNVSRTLIQPALQDVQNLPFEAAVTVMNTGGVTLDNLAIDASNNTVDSCDLALSAVHFFDASGTLEHSAIFGAQLPNVQSCASFFGNGFGVTVDSDGAGPYSVAIVDNSIHDYQRDGITAMGAGVSVQVKGNDISGLGPATGVNQFGVFLLNGAVGQVRANVITEGGCGSLAPPDCFNLRSEGVVLRAVGDGVVVDHNVITRAQAAIFTNGVNRAVITHNLIGNIEVIDAIHMQATSNSIVAGNTIFNLTPIANENCGVFEVPGPGVGVSGVEGDNQILNTTVNDAFCGVGYVPGSTVAGGKFSNVLYDNVRADQPPPPLSEP